MFFLGMEEICHCCPWELELVLSGSLGSDSGFAPSWSWSPLRVHPQASSSFREARSEGSDRVPVQSWESLPLSLWSQLGVCADRLCASPERGLPERGSRAQGLSHIQPSSPDYEALNSSPLPGQEQSGTFSHCRISKLPGPEQLCSPQPDLTTDFRGGRGTPRWKGLACSFRNSGPGGPYKVLFNL